MTIPELLQGLPAALDQVGAELTRVDGVYPQGPRIRFKVRPPASWMAGPPMLDPVGVLWYAKTGAWPSLLDGLGTATGLGLTSDDALTLLHASDEAVGVSAGPVGVVREMLIAVIEGWWSQPARSQPAPRVL